MARQLATHESLKSCLYRGQVYHARYEPVAHRFQYSLFMVYLDLSELQKIFSGRWLWSATNRPTLAWFRRRDHLGIPHLPLDHCVRDLVEEKTGTRPCGPIRLLTQLRYFGYVMNPVSYYYCFDQHEGLEAIVAEINNTPWGERHCYVIPKNQLNHANEIIAHHRKDFHVSPFMPMDLDYHWQFTVPSESLSVNIELRKAGRLMFDAQLELQRKPITSKNLMGVLFRFPCMTASIISSIYWQAFKLWWKKTPYYPHPKSLTITNTISH